MSLKDRFSEELRYLHELGNDFATDNPQLARLLGKGGSDPDVERLMEAFAFLTAKLRLKLEDDLPELTQPMLQLLWPNYLRPLPSATIIQFTPLKQALSQSHCIPKGSPLFSRPVDGVPCEFRTCTAVDIHPFEIESVSATQTLDSSVARIELRTLVERPLNTLGCDSLDFHLSGDDKTARTLYLWLAQYLKHVAVTIDGQVHRLPASSIIFPGFSANEGLLPYPQNVFDGYRILQEYFVFAKRFHFFSVSALQKVWPDQATRQVGIELHFTRQLPASLRIGMADLRLFCTPAVNLFSYSAEPIDLSNRQAPAELTPEGKNGMRMRFSVSTRWSAPAPQQTAAPANTYARSARSNRSPMRSSMLKGARRCTTATPSRSPCAARASHIASPSCVPMPTLTPVSWKRRPST